MAVAQQVVDNTGIHEAQGVYVYAMLSISLPLIVAGG